MGEKLGFSIGYDCFGYGLTIPHYGTIVCGNSNRIGNYAVLHTSTCITDTSKHIGNALYLSTGAIVTSSENIGSNVSIGANSLVNSINIESNALVVGSPAHKIKDACAWYERDGRLDRIAKIEGLKKEMNINC